MADDEVEKQEFVEGTCPLLNIDCPKGEEASTKCWLRVKGDFDPLSSFADQSILDCARERAEKMQNATLKFFN
ncbi:MAG: hypothetical protein ACE5HS_15750 [bacterium]